MTAHAHNDVLEQMGEARLVVAYCAQETPASAHAVGSRVPRNLWKNVAGKLRPPQKQKFAPSRQGSNAARLLLLLFQLPKLALEIFDLR